jgi:hypothetical protein
VAPVVVQFKLFPPSRLQLRQPELLRRAGGGAAFGGSGGGSGGAILLEAPTVAVRGTLVTNGGAGSANSSAGDDGSSGTADAIAASAGTTPIIASDGKPQNFGGSGSAAANLDGVTGVYGEPAVGGLDDFGGGGGGGAGRIRINTSSGQATVAGTVSASITTACVSQGSLRTR